MSREHLLTEVVRAGAGAGKTTRLTSKVLQLAESFYEENQCFPRVVVTTFTRKATQELKERLALKARQEGRPQLVQFVNSPSYLHISTIHGVLSLLLSRYGSSQRIQSDFNFISSQKEDLQVRRLLKEFIFSEPKYQTLLDFYSFNDLIKILRAFYEKRSFFSENFKPYSKDDFSQLQEERVREITSQMGELASSIRSETNHAKWLEEAEFFEKMSQSPLNVLKEMKFPTKPRKRKDSPDVSDETIELRKKIKSYFDPKKSNSLLAPAFDKELYGKYEQISVLFQDFAELFCQSWQEIKWSKAEITMADLETLSLQLLRESPSSANNFSMDWDYWLIDEYQDTSPLQVELLKKLIGKSPSFTVGDPQQSIYLFRGARSEVFRNREIEAQEKGEKMDFLRKNYRSHPGLLLFFNDFFSGLGDQFQEMEPHTQGDVSSEGTVARFVQVSGDKELEPKIVAQRVYELLQKGVSADQICVLARTNKGLQKIAESLQELNCPLQIHSSGGFYQRREVKDALALLKFLVNPHDNLNLLILLRSPWFKVRDQEIIDVIDSFKAHELQSYYLSFLKNKSESLDWKGFDRLCALYERARHEGILAAFDRGLSDSGMIDLSYTYDKSGRRESNLWKLVSLLHDESVRPGFNFIQFINQQEVMLNLEGGDEGDAVAAWEPDRVNLMTIHASKGLQFDHVLVPFLSKGQTRPSSSKILFSEDQRQAQWSLAIPFGDEDKSTHTVAGLKILETLHRRELEEADRVLYVALTRAKKTVSLFFNEKIEKGSWMSRIQWDLQEGGHTKEGYSYEVLSVDCAEKLDAMEFVEEESSLPEPCSYWQNLEEESVKSLSVTESLQLKEGNNYFHLNADFLEKAQLGVDLHRVFESIHYQGISYAREMIKDQFSGAETFMKALDYMENLKHPHLLHIIENGFTEWGFLHRQPQGQVIEGQIDLWGRDEKGVWVIDYKTGSDKYKDRAFEQLKVYGQALSQSDLVHDDESVFLAVIYPLEGKSEIQLFREGQ